MRRSSAIAVLCFRGCLVATLLLVANVDRRTPFLDAETIRVKVLVDEEEVAVERLWQQRLKSRVDRASEIINEYCDIRFSVAAFDRWKSDNNENELGRTLREFEIEVDPAPGHIAIGFSSQYRFRRGVNGLGGTRGPLNSHILLRESAPTIVEPERLEALVHELGHFLGAAHSPLRSSVMRPVIGDGQARLRSYRITFDPLNAELIRLVGSEVSLMRVRRFSQLSPVTRARILPIYEKLHQQMPKDPAAKRFVEYLQRISAAGAKQAPPQIQPRPWGSNSSITRP
jgi:hypothetical protein